jgi:hypothetical protein
MRQNFTHLDTDTLLKFIFIIDLINLQIAHLN